MEWGRGRTSCPYKFASLYKVSRLHVHVHVYDTPCVLCAMMHIQYIRTAHGLWIKVREKEMKSNVTLVNKFCSN